VHKVKIVGVKTLESGKFNGDTGEMENPCKGIIKWDKSIEITEAGKYNNKDCIILTTAEYEAIASGRNTIVPTEFIGALKTIGTAVLDLVQEAEGEVKK